MKPVWLDAAPVLDWLDHEIVPRYGSLSGLSEALAARSGLEPRSWQRNLRRLRLRRRIEFFSLDRLCTLLGEHVTRFLDFSEFEEVSR